MNEKAPNSSSSQGEAHESLRSELEKMSHSDLVEFALQNAEKLKELEKLVTEDPLMGINSRRKMQQEFQAYSNSHKEGAPPRKEGYKHASVLFFDIDHFKKVNDTYGHAVGDAVLVKVASSISEHVRGDDEVGRWGGEEITALLYGTTEAEATEIAERIRIAIESLTFDGIDSALPELKVTTSVGVAEFVPNAPYEEIVARADGALYEAKNAGRNRVIRHSKME